MNHTMGSPAVPYSLIDKSVKCGLKCKFNSAWNSYLAYTEVRSAVKWPHRKEHISNVRVAPSNPIGLCHHPYASRLNIQAACYERDYAEMQELFKVWKL